MPKRLKEKPPKLAGWDTQMQGGYFNLKKKKNAWWLLTSIPPFRHWNIIQKYYNSNRTLILGNHPMIKIIIYKPSFGSRTNDCNWAILGQLMSIFAAACYPIHLLFPRFKDPSIIILLLIFLSHLTIF